MTRSLMRALAAAFGLAAITLSVAPAAHAQEQAITTQSWSWQGVTGQFDYAQVRRGFQIYHDVCSNCHSLKFVAYRNLSEIGLPPAQIIATAAEKKVTDGPNNSGDMFQRPATPADNFVPPFPNDQAARASNGGALPPDLSLIVLARDGGPDYVYSILTGFTDPPAGAAPVPNGLHYNAAFPGNHIAMPQPLHGNDVKFADGSPNSLQDEARDVVSFLTWASQPELPERHNLGIKVIIFLSALTILFYVVKVRIWSRVH